MATAEAGDRAQAMLDAGLLARARGDHAAALADLAEAMRLRPSWRAPVQALTELGAADVARALARETLTPGLRATRKSAGGRLGIFTVASNNYAAHACSFLESAAEHYPDAVFYLIVVDREPLHPSSYPRNCHVLMASEIGIGSFSAMALRYNVVELNTAVKPFAFLHLMEVEGLEQVLYFDPDILVFRPSREILTQLDAGASVVLTPHMCVPPGARSEPNDTTLLRAGAFNLGFLAARHCEETTSLMRWWSRHLQFNCLDRPDDGLFVDQRYMDLAPSYFPNVAIYRGTGANVAYWNLTDRPLTREADVVHAGGVPLEFFHFSGFDPRHPGRLSKYTRLFQPMQDRLLVSLTGRYAHALHQHGFARLIGQPYSYDLGHDGRRISQAVRSHFADTYLVWEGDPFDSIEQLEREIVPPRRSTTRGTGTMARLGRWTGLARQYVRRILTLPHGAGVPVLAGYGLLLLRWRAGGLAAFRGAQSRVPGSADLNFMLGELCEERGLRDAAAGYYASALQAERTCEAALRQLVSLGEAERGYDILRAAWEPAIVPEPRTSGGKLAIFTVVTRVDWPSARVMLRSACDSYPDASLFVVAVDGVDVPADMGLPAGVVVVDARDLGIRGFADMARRYRASELAAAIKPFVFTHLFDVEGFDTAVFLAPEAMIYAPSPVVNLLAGSTSVVLTPHRLAPPSGPGQASDDAMLREGTIDTGFVAVRRAPEARRFLDWWARHLEFNCRDRPQDGCFFDRKILDLATSYFETVHLYRSEGANVGHRTGASQSSGAETRATEGRACNQGLAPSGHTTDLMRR